MLEVVVSAVRGIFIALVGAAVLYLSIAYAIGIYAAAWAWIV